jgi:hypothetical protein
MNQITKIRVVEVNHTKGTLSAVGKYNGKKESMNFQFADTYRTIEVNFVQEDQINFNLSQAIFQADTYPQAGDELALFDNKGQVLGWCYYLEYELALFKYKRKQPILVTGWMKTLGIISSDKLTERLIKDKFRELSKELHPDKSNGDATEFRKLVSARDEALRSISRQ